MLNGRSELSSCPCGRAVEEMERNFSYDDIAGTIWHGGYDPGFGVETTGAGNEDEDGFMKRSESEFAFQEFIKRSLPKDAFTIVSSDDEGEKDVDIPYPPVRNGAERAEDYTDALVPDGAGINGAPSLEDRSNPSGQKPDYATPTGKPSAPKVDGHVNLSPFKPKETAEKSSCEEPEINALLNPLFSGLRSEMIPTAAGRDQQYYQEKLDELCQHARKHRVRTLPYVFWMTNANVAWRSRLFYPGRCFGSMTLFCRETHGKKCRFPYYARNLSRHRFLVIPPCTDFCQI